MGLRSTAISLYGRGIHSTASSMISATATNRPSTTACRRQRLRRPPVSSAAYARNSPQVASRRSRSALRREVSARCPTSGSPSTHVDHLAVILALESLGCCVIQSHNVVVPHLGNPKSRNDGPGVCTCKIAVFTFGTCTSASTSAVKRAPSTYTEIRLGAMYAALRTAVKLLLSSRARRSPSGPHATQTATG